MKSISGVHALLFSPRASAVRTFFKEKLDLRSVDAGGGWLIFALPPAEIAVHPGEKGLLELYLLCDDMRATIKELGKRGVKFVGRTQDRGWGMLARAKLPDGSTIGIYEPKHPTPLRRRKRG
jgi:hypothetical protein